MTRRLAASYLGLTLVVLVALGVPLERTTAEQERQRLAVSARSDAAVLASQLNEPLQGLEVADAGSSTEWNAAFQPIRRYAERVGARVIVTDTAGLTIADTDTNQPLGRDFSSRPEIAAALDGRIGSSYRHSQSLNQELLVAAAPIASAGTVFGVLRISVPAKSVERTIATTRWRLLLVAAAVLMAATVIGFVMARSMTAPLHAMVERARSVGRGQYQQAPAPAGAPAELVELNDALNQMAARVESSLAAQRAFVGDASHQLRTPLTAIQLRLENLTHGTTTKDTEAALRELARMRHLVDQLLALTRAESREVGENVDLAELAAERVDIWQATVGETSGTLELDSAPVPLVCAPNGTVEQMLDNVIDNAWRARPDGPIRVRVTRSGDEVVVDVIDHGPGLSEADKQHALQRFWRGRSDQGSGLGLPIVASLLSHIGGGMDLADTPVGGLTVRLRFPAPDQPKG